MLNNLKYLKNLFAISFTLLILSIIIKYNSQTLIDGLLYLNIKLPMIGKLTETENIKLYSAILMLISGILLFIFGFKINKMEDKK